MESKQEKLEDNPYLLLGIPYGADLNTANKAFAAKSLEYRKQGKDLSPLTSAVANIGKVQEKVIEKEAYFAIPSQFDILSPKIPGLQEYIIPERELGSDEESGLYVNEYTPLGVPKQGLTKSQETAMKQYLEETNKSSRGSFWDSLKDFFIGLVNLGMSIFNAIIGFAVLAVGFHLVTLLFR
jgi:hypothetical protein